MSPPLLTFAEYLKFEDLYPGRHELVRGEVRLMSGATERHDLLTQLVNLELGNAFRGGPCRVFPHNRKLAYVCDDTCFHPDIVVFCGPAANRQYEDDATWVVEVRSPSNSAADLREKLTYYTRLPSLRGYLLLDPATRAATLHERHDLGWSARPVADQKVEFGSAVLDLPALFDKLDRTATTD